MANRLEEKLQERQVQVNNEVLAAVEFELLGSVAHSGGLLTGISVKFGDSDVLMTLRAIIAGKPQVAFVGCPDLATCLRKAVTEAYHDGLQWRLDQYARSED